MSSTRIVFPFGFFFFVPSSVELFPIISSSHFVVYHTPCPLFNGSMCQGWSPSSEGKGLTILTNFWGLHKNITSCLERKAEESFEKTPRTRTACFRATGKGWRQSSRRRWAKLFMKGSRGWGQLQDLIFNVHRLLSPTLLFFDDVLFQFLINVLDN